MAWKSAGDRCRNISSWSVTSRIPNVARVSSDSVTASSPTRSRVTASANSAAMSFSHNSVDWCTTWKSNSSRCIISSGRRCRASSVFSRM